MTHEEKIAATLKAMKEGKVLDPYSQEPLRYTRNWWPTGEGWETFDEFTTCKCSMCTYYRSLK